MKKVPLDFPIKFYNFSEEKVNETITKARLRIFYKGLNRNGGYITDDFAEKLISTLPYAPVKGIYENGDFTDHGEKREEGRIYGIVPKDYNFAWEDHEDEDGKTRTYACCDVYLYTALYSEAKEIVGKAHSMELFKDSIKGAWRALGGQEVFEYTDACFLGLQVLGEGVEPCFEGSAFFTKDKDDDQLLCELLSKYTKVMKGTTMNKDVIITEYALTANQREHIVSKALNSQEKYRYYVCDSTETSAIIMDWEEEKSYRVNYSINEEGACIVDMENKTEVFHSYLSIEEMNALDSIKESTQKSTFAEIKEEIEILHENSEKLADTESKLNDANESIATLEQTKVDLENDKATLVGEKEALSTENASLIEEKETLSTEKATLETTVATLTETNKTLSEQLNTISEEATALRTFKAEVEKQEKLTVCSRYENKLSEEILQKYMDSIDNYTRIDLEKELAFELVNSSKDIFSDNAPGMVPVLMQSVGLAAVLDKYK